MRVRRRILFKSDHMSQEQLALLKQRRIGYLFFLLWGAFVLAWSLLVGVSGRFRYGRGGPSITPEGEPYFFWTVVLASGLLGLIVIVSSLFPFLRSLRSEGESSEGEEGVDD